MAKRVWMPYINGKRINRELAEGWIPVKMETICGFRFMEFIAGPKKTYSCQLVDEKFTWKEKAKRDETGDYECNSVDDFITEEYTDRGRIVHRLHLQTIPYKTFTKEEEVAQLKEVKGLAGVGFSWSMMVLLDIMLVIQIPMCFDDSPTLVPVWLAIAIVALALFLNLISFVQWFMYWVAYRKANKTHRGSK